MDDRCAVPGCPRDMDLIYLGHGVCTYHWDRLTAEDIPPERLRMVLGIEVETPAAMEEAMTEKKTETKTAKKAKTPKEGKPKREKAPKEDLVVFAFRLTEAERDAIHKTAGPARASSFIRRVGAAFAAEDEAAFRAAVKEAREARQ